MSAATVTISQNARVYATSLLTILQGLLPPPARVLTPPELSWNFDTFIDSQSGIVFYNFGVTNIVNGKAVIDKGFAFLYADVPLAQISKFSKSIIINFKPLRPNDSVNFLLKMSHAGSPQRRDGLMMRVVDGHIDFQLHGPKSPSPDFFTNTLHSIYEPITGFPDVLLNKFCNLAVTFDHTTDIVKTYINGVLNSETYARVASASAEDVALGTDFYVTTFVPIYINRWVEGGVGLVELDDFKFFNQALTQEEITAYYEMSI
jgi:hypothetical protein